MTICLASPQGGQESKQECFLPSRSRKEQYPVSHTASLGFGDIQRRGSPAASGSAGILPAALPAGQKDRPLGRPLPGLNLSLANVQTEESVFCGSRGHMSPP